MRVNAIAIAELMLGLSYGCHTMLELADQCGLSIQTVRNYCTQLHKRQVTHITDWREDSKGGRTLKVYQLGPGEDKRKPRRQSATVSCAKYRAKKKQIQMLQAMAAPVTPAT